MQIFSHENLQSFGHFCTEWIIIFKTFISRQIFYMLTMTSTTYPNYHLTKFPYTVKYCSTQNTVDVKIMVRYIQPWATREWGHGRPILLISCTEDVILLRHNLIAGVCADWIIHSYKCHIISLGYNICMPMQCSWLYPWIEN